MYLKIKDKKIDVKIADTWSKKIKGLSFIKNISYGLIIPNCNHIHTFFMKENIDVLFIDYRGVVMYKYQSMPPGRTFRVFEDINKTSVLELPNNTSEYISIGDVLCFEGEHVV